MNINSIDDTVPTQNPQLTQQSPSRRYSPAHFLVPKSPNITPPINGNFYPSTNALTTLYPPQNHPVKNTTMSLELKGACSCGPCGNNGLFNNYMHAYNQNVSSETTRYGVYNMILPYNEAFDLQIPINTSIPGNIMFTIKFTTKRGVSVTHKYTTLGRLLKFLQSFDGSFRKLNIELNYKYFNADVKIGVKPDHCNKLVMCFYNDDSNPKIFIQMSDLQHAYDAINANAKPVNTSHCYRLLGGHKKVAGRNPGFPVNKRKQVPPCMQPFADYNSLSPNITEKVSQNLFMLGISESGIHRIILGYIAPEVQVAGPLVDSPLRFLFNGPLYDPNLLNILALFMYCPRKLSALGDAYTKSERYPTLKEQRELRDAYHKEL